MDIKGMQQLIQGQAMSILTSGQEDDLPYPAPMMDISFQKLLQ